RLQAQQAELLHRERDARAEAEAVEGTLAFLLNASTVLGSTLDYESTLDALTHLCVESIADIAIADMLEDGEINRTAMAHRRELPGRLVDAVRAYRPDPEGDHPVARVLRTGEPDFGPGTQGTVALFAPPGVLRQAAGANPAAS